MWTMIMATDAMSMGRLGIAFGCPAESIEAVSQDRVDAFVAVDLPTFADPIDLFPTGLAPLDHPIGAAVGAAVRTTHVMTIGNDDRHEHEPSRCLLGLADRRLS